ncbi:hypothetical protein BT96DRAFT_1043724 [Gymnopus androsaceus JB14]|uniref:Uncharacterized protein n=1 Tax=Gymnopus androsaceus JB14 TaxID=1447944 RepID=A0A6A4HCK2_9AGAR|nr:hypothetical protein BT96DRAFT_1043724 [Gymnopus androsaceus JB14]
MFDGCMQLESPLNVSFSVLICLKYTFQKVSGTDEYNHIPAYHSSTGRFTCDRSRYRLTGFPRVWNRSQVASFALRLPASQVQSGSTTSPSPLSERSFKDDPDIPGSFSPQVSQVPQLLSSLNLNLGQLEMEAEVVHLLAQLDLDGSPDVKHNEATLEQDIYEASAQQMPDALQLLAATDAVNSMQSVLSQALHAKAFCPSPTFGHMPSPRSGD